MLWIFFVNWRQRKNCSNSNLTKQRNKPIPCMTVEMFINENCQKTFAELLIRRGFMKSIDPPPEWNPMAVDYQKPGNLLCPIFFDSTLGLFTE